MQGQLVHSYERERVARCRANAEDCYERIREGQQEQAYPFALGYASMDVEMLCCMAVRLMRRLECVGQELAEAIEGKEYGD